MFDFIIDFYNKHFNKKINYEYSDFLDCRIYDFYYEESDTNV